MHHTGNGGTSAVFHIGSSSRNGSGGGDPTEQCGSNVAGALGDQFHIGTMSAVHHTVRYHAGKQ